MNTVVDQNVYKLTMDFDMNKIIYIYINKHVSKYR